jgi:hypothetical protein
MSCRQLKLQTIWGYHNYGDAISLIHCISLFILRYEHLIPGVQELSAEYCSKLYSFCSEVHLDKFMR